MHIAIEGCAHGELDIIYKAVEELQKKNDLKIELLICCGDFQAVRNKADLKCMAVPQKYMKMHDFHEYYCGLKLAPILTIFIGGNHEASNHLQELPYGGWVAPNIYYLGYAGVVKLGSLRIGGLSGIYKGPDYLKGHFEKSPYDDSSVRSVYHVRNLEVFRLKQLSGEIDIFLSHDWPRSIYHHGETQQLINTKRHFEGEINENTLGSRPAEDILKKLKPKLWFAGHLHVKFAAIYHHKDDDKEEAQQRKTKFLALDKCLPRRDFLQILQLDCEQCDGIQLQHDEEWITILRLTDHLLSTNSGISYMPGPGYTGRYDFTPTEEEISQTKAKFGSLNISPSDFTVSAGTDPTASSEDESNLRFISMPDACRNPQTEKFCARLGVTDPMALLCGWKTPSDSAFTVSNVNFNASELNVTLNTSGNHDQNSLNETPHDERSWECHDIVLALDESTGSKESNQINLLDVTPTSKQQIQSSSSSKSFSTSGSGDEIKEVNLSAHSVPEEGSLSRKVIRRNAEQYSDA